MAKKAITKVTETQEVSGKSTGWPTAVVLGVLGVLSVVGLSKYMQKRAQEQASGSLQNDENARMATSLYNILKNGGALDWYYTTHYPTVLGVLDVAKQIKDWAKVQARYTDLYSADITQILNKTLLPADYQTFLKNLSAKGLPTNGSGSGTIQVVTTLKKGDILRFNAKANTSVVNLYKSTADYPGKPYISLPIGTKTTNNITFQSSIKFKYLGSSVDTIMYLVSIPGFSVPVYVNDYFLSKKL